MSKKDEENYKPRSERNKDKHRESRQVDEDVQDRKGFFIVLIILFLILIFLLYLIFSGDSESDQASNIETSSDQITVQETSDTSDQEERSEDTATNDTSETASEEEAEDEDTEDDTSESEAPQNSIEEQNADNNLEEVEPSEDAVVAYEGDWDPIGTEQSGSHTTNFNNGSQDRLEIKEAVANVTGLDPDTMIEHWIGNDGTANGVYATASDREQSQFYRVHLTWNDGQGWQAQSIEILE